VSRDTGPTHAREAAASVALCGDKGPSPWTGKRNAVTCDGCLADIKRRLAIRCDYCEALAVLFIPNCAPAYPPLRRGETRTLRPGAWSSG